MKQFKFANKIIEFNDKTQTDTLGVIIRNLTQYTDFDRQGNIYETLVNSGEIKLLRNHEIVNNIRELEEKYIYINRIENIHYDAMMKHVVPAINPVIKLSDASIQKPEEVFNYEFQNLIISLIQVMTEKDKVYNEALLLTPEGEIQETYEKLHLFDVNLGPGIEIAESKSYNPGRRLNTFEIDGWKIATCIWCVLRFLEIFLNYVLKELRG